MQVFALFPSSYSLEHATTVLQKEGIDSEDIFVVSVKELDNMELPVDKRYPKGLDAIDKGFAFATAVSVITAGIGFRLTLGPIIWGIIGAFSGFLIGLLISFIQIKKNGQSLFKSTLPPIILIVNCEEQHVIKIERILHENGALGVNTPLNKGSNMVSN
jgi:hypothetical protein